MTTAQRIPLRPSLAAQSVNVTLDGRGYRVDLDWLGRIERWCFSLYTSSGEPVLRTKGLVLGADLLKRTRYRTDCPQGLLILRDLQDLEVEASLDSLGVRHVLMYVPLTELP